MSFSSEIKDELCRVEVKNECCVMAELVSVFLMNRANGAPPDRLITENAAFARRAYYLLRRLFATQPDIIVSRRSRLKKNASYIIRLNAAMSLPGLRGAGEGEGCGATGAGSGEAGAVDAGVLELRKLTKKKCCKKAALRGAFLAGGSVSDPEKLYHLEIYGKNLGLMECYSEMMDNFDLRPKITERVEHYVLYIKDSGRIVDFLNVAGAHRALMSLENTRILKDMRNNVNRAVNCETANLEKTVNASLRQLTNIMFIRDAIGFDALPEGLREIAAARAQNREISLKELGQILDPPIGKSGVNHRLRKLEQIADEIRANPNQRSAPPPRAPNAPSR